jgi:hypothetical protein
MKVAKLEPTVKCSRAAYLLDKTPRTLARYEQQGILTPIKLNCRSVVYRLSEVQRLLGGAVEMEPGLNSTRNFQRTAAGNFLPQHLAKAGGLN